MEAIRDIMSFVDKLKNLELKLLEVYNESDKIYMVILNEDIVSEHNDIKSAISDFNSYMP